MLPAWLAALHAALISFVTLLVSTGHTCWWCGAKACHTTSSHLCGAAKPASCHSSGHRLALASSIYPVLMPMAFDILSENYVFVKNIRWSRYPGALYSGLIALQKTLGYVNSLFCSCSSYVWHGTFRVWPAFQALDTAVEAVK